MDNTTRRESLPDEEKYCNGCVELQVNRVHGARGQVIMPFGNGICRCDLEALMWAYRGVYVDRPIECILNKVSHAFSWL